METLTLIHQTLRQRHEVCYWAGAISLLGVVACLLLIFVSSTQFMGHSAWIKPMKFFASAVFYFWTLGWLSGYYVNSSGWQVSIWLGIAIWAFELGYVFWRASRGEASHFNISTPTSSMLYGAMGIGAVVLSVIPLHLLILTQVQELTPAYMLSIKLGILLFVVFALEGGIMGARLQHGVGVADGTGRSIPFVGWSLENGDLRIAHFAGMHALQIMPWLGHSVLHQVWQVVVAGLVYLALAGWLLWQALQGRPVA